MKAEEAAEKLGVKLWSHPDTQTDPLPGSGTSGSEHEHHEDVDAAPARGFSALWVFFFLIFKPEF